MKIVFVILLGLLSVCSQALVIVQYHHISDETPPSTSISPALFRAHMDTIEKAQFQVVSILQLRTWLEKGKNLPDKTVVITFDDGYRSVYTEAFPELKKRKWPFAVFVNTKALDEKSPQVMSWEELRTMADNGATIANHSDSHPHLIRQQAYENFEQWQGRREREINFAEDRIAEKIGKSHKLFAYPFGEYDRALQAQLKELGFIAFGQQSGPVVKGSDQRALPRFPFGGAYGDLEDFSLKLNSLAFPESRIKVTDAGGKVLLNPELPAQVGKPVLRIASPLLPYVDGAACFASGQGKINAEIKGGVLVAQALHDLPPGRSRYNCTVSAGGGRFYWHSQLFIRRLPNGEWLNE